MATPDDCTNATPEHMFGHVLRPDELLRHVRYDFAEPCTDLAPWIDRYWSVEWDLAPGKIFHTATVDDPAVNLSIERGGIARPGTTGPGFWLTGPATVGRFDVSLRGSGSVVAVKFQVGGTVAFANADLAALRDRTVPAAQWFGSDAWASDLPPSASEASSRLDAWLLALGPSTDAGYDRFRMMHALLDDPTVARLDDVADRVGCDMRTLQRTFRRYTGVGPKRMLVRARVMAAVAALDRGWPGSLTELAHEFGWFDQAHLIRDFRRITGMTPAGYADRDTVPGAPGTNR